MPPVGIDLISFATSPLAVSLSHLAEHTGQDVAKYFEGLGQEAMSVVSQDEDVITLAYKAASRICQQIDTTKITSLIFATETGVDQSNSAASFLNKLLDLPNNIRNIELKQACYSATFGLKAAADHVRLNPNEQVLVVASDIARYDFNTPGEATQGCGAVAMLISVNPRIVELQDKSGIYSDLQNDFWRPNYRNTALVDGKLSAKFYLQFLKNSFNDWQQKTALNFESLDYFCYHLPFSKMAYKAHQYLSSYCKQPFEPSKFEKTTFYNSLIGNSYTASLYIGLVSLLEQQSNLANKLVGMFSYGSGAVSEFFSLKVKAGYENFLFKQEHQDQLEQRHFVNFKEYRNLYRPLFVDSNGNARIEYSLLDFIKDYKYPRFIGVENHIRRYAS